VTLRACVTVPAVSSLVPGAPMPMPVRSLATAPAWVIASSTVATISSATPAGPWSFGVGWRDWPRTRSSSSITTVWIFVPPRSTPARNVIVVSLLCGGVVPWGLPMGRKLSGPAGGNVPTLAARRVQGVWMNRPFDETDQLCVNTVRTLSLDAVEKAKSGHPGLPLGAAPMAHVIWTRHLRYNPADPDWPGRDRFVLSGGHGCMLLYSLLHLTGYDLPLEELKQFRQWGSRTPGHPEYGH